MTIACNAVRMKGMRYRWLAVGALAGTLALGGCAPAQTGESPDEEASAEAEVQAEPQEAAPSMAAEPAGDSDGENSAPDDYDY